MERDLPQAARSLPSGLACGGVLLWHQFHGACAAASLHLLLHVECLVFVQEGELLTTGEAWMYSMMGQQNLGNGRGTQTLVWRLHPLRLRRM